MTPDPTTTDLLADLERSAKLAALFDALVAYTPAEFPSTRCIVSEAPEHDGRLAWATWQRVYEARDAFFSEHFGPLPTETTKLWNLMVIWPGGCLYSIDASRQGGRGVCVTSGLSNFDMPTTVAARDQSVPAGGGIEGTLAPRTPAWVPRGRAGYGYEIAILTPRPESWPVLALSWFPQAEILRDIDLLARVEEGGGVTIESLPVGDGKTKADFLVAPALPPLPAAATLPNGTMRLLIATRITRAEMRFAQASGRSALIERLARAGVGQLSVLDRASVV